MSELKNNGENNGGFIREDDPIHELVHVSGMYENWFLDYASYVILERAVPAIQDGLKPVQRRILHAMKEMDDGRYNKVANIIGSTMQYHPHGDASIGDAIIGLGQKDLLIDQQGNWGDVRTGDSAAAPRYIEARLTKFALEVLYNPQTTKWQLSYDGRKKEPVAFPVKFPLLLAQGVEGIAVGLSTKILPHNFRELLRGCVDLLKGKKVNILPDFATGGLGDFSDYNEGMRGGKVRVRARIDVLDKKTIVIKDIPYGTTTTNLIESIIKANDKGKIKIKKVVDNTARDVEILVSLASGQSPDITIDALYAFTDCEVSISPNACVILDNKPIFISVNEMLRISNNQTVELLKRELEIRKGELLEKILFSSLERIFIENRIYRDIEECETWESVIETIDQGLTPFKPQFYREITSDDVVRLTEIKIKRISRFDSFKADEALKRLQDELEETKYNLANLMDYAIKYYEHLLEKYGKGKERKTEIRTFDTISATVVAANNARLYVNREEGFIGYGIKKDEFVTECSDLDDIIVFKRDGKMLVTKIAEKVFVGKNVIHVDVFNKNDERMVYNLIYTNVESGRSMIKRFKVLGVTRDKPYDLGKGAKGSIVLYFSANPNGEAEVVTVHLSNRCRARIKVFDFDFSEIDIKGRGAGGNILTRYPVKKIQLKTEGKSTLGGVDIYYDDSIGRLNRDQRGILLGNFHSDDLILVLYKNGTYELTNFELTNRYEPNSISALERFDPEVTITAVYKEGSSALSFVKRFKIETSTTDKKFSFISDTKGSLLHFVTTDPQSVASFDMKKKRSKEQAQIALHKAVDIKGWKAVGKRISPYEISKVKQLVASSEEQGGKGKSPKVTLSVPSEEITPDPSEKKEKPIKKKKKSRKIETKQGPSEVKKPEKEDVASGKGKDPEERVKDTLEGKDKSFHPGDTVEFNIKENDNKDKPDQLDLFGK